MSAVHQSYLQWEWFSMNKWEIKFYAHRKLAWLRAD